MFKHDEQMEIGRPGSLGLGAVPPVVPPPPGAGQDCAVKLRAVQHNSAREQMRLKTSPVM